jgi:hypothetical protein
MKLENIENILSKKTTCPSKWELDTIIYFDRTTNPDTLIRFLSRIKFLSETENLDNAETEELSYLLELLEDLDEDECDDILNRTEDECRDAFIEALARSSAIEVLTSGRLSFESMHTACKLSPNDFILCAKRTQDLINSIQGLVIKGETLSKDVAGA